MNRLFKSLMLSIFILSNILTPLSYANFEEDLTNKPEQKNTEIWTTNDSWMNENEKSIDNADSKQISNLEESTNPEIGDTESTPKNIDDNIEGVNTKNLMKLKNNTPILRAVTTNDGCYTFDTDTQTITAYNCTDTDIEIPSEIDWVEVKIIWWWSNTTDWAFYNKWLTSVIFPDTVTTIKQNAFTKNNLNVVYFGNSITSIERYGFFANASNPVIGIVPKDTSLVSNHNQSYITLVRWYKVIYKDWDDTYETLVTTWIVENLPWTKEWYELVWWYTDSDLSTPFDFTQSITADTILYGKWYKIYNDGCYTFNEWTQTITAYNASCGTDIVIPSSLDNVEVKIIWWWSNTTDWAFYNKWLTSVIFPDTVTTIKQNAFTKNNLNVVYFGNSITSIERYGFFANASNPVIGIVPKDTSLVSNHNQSYITLVRWYNVSYIDSWVTVKTTVTTWVVDDYLLDTREWYLFDAWYKDENYTEKFDFSGTQTNPITEDTALYAKWDEIVRTDDWCYKFNKDKKTIIWFGWTWTCGSDIEIPSQIDGVSVESIWWWAMNWSWAFFEAWLTSVKIPDSVKEIQDRAFLHNELNYVSLWNSIEKIWRHAFQRNKLETIYIPNSVTEIWNWAFSRNAVADIPCSTHSWNYWFWVVWVYLSGDDTHLFGKDTCLQFQQWYSVKYMSWDSLYREDVSTWTVKNIELTWKNYYNFSGWYTNNTFSSKFDFSTIITWNTTLFAYWDPVVYNIVYELNDWINNSNNPSKYTIESEDITLKNPSKTWYSFIWWTNIDTTTPDMTITISKWSTGDKSYIANWNINQYTITFDTAWWNKIDPITVDYWTSITPPANPTKPRQTFIWRNPTIPATMPNYNLTVIAQRKSSASWRWRISSNNVDNQSETTSDSDTKDNENENSKNEEKSNSDSNSNWDNDQELLDAYNWAVSQWLITSSFDDLLNEWELTRAELARIAVKYVHTLWMEKKLDENVSYPDVNSSLWELENYIKSAYQYQIMWIHANGSKLTNFKPNKFVSRWEFATVFSRILHGFEYNINWSNFYEKHLEVLKSEWILKDTNPARIEEKKWVILMMYRQQKNN